MFLLATKKGAIPKDAAEANKRAVVVRAQGKATGEVPRGDEGLGSAEVVQREEAKTK